MEAEGNKGEPLTEYVRIPRKLWGKLPSSGYVRYTTGDGSLKKGGFFTSILEEKESGKSLMRLRNDYRFNPEKKAVAMWTVDLGEIKDVYLKSNVAVVSLYLQMATTVEKFNENLEEVASCLGKFDDRIRVLEEKLSSGEV